MCVQKENTRYFYMFSSLSISQGSHCMKTNIYVCNHTSSPSLSQSNETWCLVHQEAVTLQTTNQSNWFACIVLHSIQSSKMRTPLKFKGNIHNWKHINLTFQSPTAGVSQGGITGDFQSDFSLTLRGYTASRVLRAALLCVCAHPSGQCNLSLCIEAATATERTESS